jgi:hypothetical protein
VTALVVVPSAHAATQSRPDRPPGVAASSWIPVTHDFGAVVEQRLPGRYSGGQPTPSALGYFVAWRGDHWLRLDSLLLQSGTLRSPAAAAESISLAGNLKFVVERQMRGQPMRQQTTTPSAVGYFVIKRSDGWLRLAPDPQGALYRGPLRPPSTSNWLAISSGLRFVIEQQAPERDAGAGQLPSVLGYFIAKRDGRWVRLNSTA